MVAAAFTVGPPLELLDGWDLLREDPFDLLVRLSTVGRIGLMFMGPPCTAYSLARCPRLRSVSESWGFEVLEMETLHGNLHMHQCLSLFFTQTLTGNKAVVGGLLTEVAVVAEASQCVY